MSDPKKDYNVYHKTVDKDQALKYLHGHFANGFDDTDLQWVNWAMARTADETRQQAHENSFRFSPNNTLIPSWDFASPEEKERELAAAAETKTRLRAKEASGQKLTNSELSELWLAEKKLETGKDVGYNCMQTYSDNYPHQQIWSNREFLNSDKDGLYGRGRYMEIGHDELLPGDAAIDYNGHTSTSGHALMYNGQNDKGKDTFNHSNGTWNYKIADDGFKFRHSVNNPETPNGQFRYFRYVGEGSDETRDKYLKLGMGYAGSAKMNAAAQARFEREVQDLAKPTNTVQQYEGKPLPGISAVITNANTNTKRRK